MPSTALMWFRRDLRVHDLPALAGAARADRIVPVFVFDDRLLRTGRFPSANRTAFMLGCLRELDAELRDRGARLAVRHGRPEREILALAREVGAEDVFFTADSSPWSRRRDQQVIDTLAADGVRAHASPGAFVVDDPSNLRTGQGKPYTVFTPFHRTWENEERREPATTPRTLSPPSGLKTGRMPSLSDLGVEEEPDLPFEPGEKAARRAMSAFLREPVKHYDDLHNRAAGGTSRLSPYLRWGCLSPRELEEKASERRGAGAAAFVRQLAWRDFYAAVLMHFPFVVEKEFQEKYRDLEWARKSKKLDAWKQGRTGYPFVDAGMRQLVAEGWMHNRLRLVVGSFLTKDLHLDWRLGEAFFMEHLVDGDMAANNGNWQWVSSVGTDPKPYFQRLFNPVRQQQKFDPDGEYVRRWVPELADVPDSHLAEPWTMSEGDQQMAGCVIGQDYPEPIVDHAEERRVAQERYRAVSP